VQLVNSNSAKRCLHCLICSSRKKSDLRLVAAWSLSKIGGKEVAEALVALQERSENEDEIDLIEDAIENLTFTEESEEPALLDFSEEDLEDLANPTKDGNPDSET